MNPAKTAVAEYANHIRAARFDCKAIDDGIGGRQIESWFSGLLQALDQAIGIEPFMRLKLLQASDLSDADTVRHPERLREFVLENVPAGGIGARFKHRPNPLA